MRLREAIAIIICTCTHIAAAQAQIDIVEPDLSTNTKIAPAYFGPNAFPIPDMLDGTDYGKFLIEFGGDYFDGYLGDKTYDIHTKITIPLFSDRVNFSGWIQSIYEYYEMSEESHANSRLPDYIEYKGIQAGDGYLSTDVHVIRQTKFLPDLTARITLKSAMGHGFYQARYYDAPGYFFDTSVAKSIKFHNSFFEELRAVATYGFLCWQTDNGRQNDCKMYGAQLKLTSKLFTISGSFGGYGGWEKDGDAPQSIKSELRFRLGRWEPYMKYQRGLRDWPFEQYRGGIGYRF